MPYNVITITCTVFALYFGSLLNALRRRRGEEERLLQGKGETLLKFLWHLLCSITSKQMPHKLLISCLHPLFRCDHFTTLLQLFSYRLPIHCFLSILLRLFQMAFIAARYCWKLKTHNAPLDSYLKLGNSRPNNMNILVYICCENRLIEMHLIRGTWNACWRVFISWCILNMEY